MKKTIKTLIGFLAFPAMLASCNGFGGESSMPLFYTNPPSNGNMFQKMYAAEDDSTIVYVAAFSSNNRSGSDITVSKDDFTVTVDGTTSKAYAIVESWGMSGSYGSDSKVYITKKSDSVVINSIDTSAATISMPLFQLAFTVNGNEGNSYSFAYKGTQIKAIGE